MGEVYPNGAALVVGGSGGVGAIIAQALAHAGTAVALTYRNNQEAAQHTSAAIVEAGQKATTHQVDLVDEVSVRSLIEDVVSEHGALHTIVHAAGSSIDQPYISKTTSEQWRAVIDADVHGVFHVVSAGLPHLREAKGSFLFVSSAGLKRFPPGDVLSVAPKGAVEALVRGLAREEGRFGVRANNVALGIIDAGMFHRLVASGELDDAYLEASKRNIALRRFGTADEVASAVVFLTSSAGSYITGQTLMLDGGYSV